MPEVLVEQPVSALHRLVTQVATKYYGENAAFDPAMIFVFLDLAKQLLAAFQQCKAAPTGAPAVLKTHPAFSRIFVRHNLKKEMGARAFRQERGERLVDSYLEVANAMTDPDWNAIYLEVEAE